MARVACELAASPVALPFPRLAEAWRQVHGHSAAAGSEGIEHGRLPSGCASGGRLPPLGRSNDCSPPTEMPPYPPHRAPPHARYRPCGALPVWVLLSTTILCSNVCQPLICSRRPVPPSGLSSNHTPCRCVGPSPPGHTVGLRRCGMVQHVSVELMGSWGRAIARPRPPRRACATPIFVGRQKAV